jgi:hypothetical protein
MTAVFPADPAGVLAWAHLVLLWCVAHFARHAEPVGARAHAARPGRARTALLRAALLAVSAFALLAPAAGAALLALGLAAASFGFTRGRARFAVPTGRGDVWEVSFAVGVPVALAFALAVAPDVRLRTVWLVLPTSDAEVARGLLIAAAFLVATRGGTHFVRGLLDRLRIGDRPDRDSHLLIDPPTFAAGRVIGELERALLLLFALDGNYAAAGFLVAAKGFIRAREAAAPGFAEYVVVGTLASFLFAAAVAAATRLGLRACG